MRWLICLLVFANIGGGWAWANEAPAIKSIALIRVPEPREISVMGKGSIAMAFGAVGAAATALDAQANSKGLLGAIARSRFSFSEQLTQDIVSALAGRGIKTRLVNPDRNNRPDRLLDDYSSITPEGAEGILDIAVVALGYATEHFLFSPHWRPEVNVLVGLARTGTSERVYEQRIMYGLHNPFLSAAKLHAPQQYQFADQEAMEAAEDAVLIGGLKDASKAIATHVARSVSPTANDSVQP